MCIILNQNVQTVGTMRLQIDLAIPYRDVNIMQSFPLIFQTTSRFHLCTLISIPSRRVSVKPSAYSISLSINMLLENGPVGSRT